MGEFVRQHFVPKLLQRFFSTDGQSIGCYSLSTKECVQTSIRTTAQKRWYYKFDDQEKTVLEHWLGEMEDEVAPVLADLLMIRTINLRATNLSVNHQSSVR